MQARNMGDYFCIVILRTDRPSPKNKPTNVVVHSCIYVCTGFFFKLIYLMMTLIGSLLFWWFINMFPVFFKGKPTIFFQMIDDIALQNPLHFGSLEPKTSVISVAAPDTYIVQQCCSWNYLNPIIYLTPQRWNTFSSLQKTFASYPLFSDFHGFLNRFLGYFFLLLGNISHLWSTMYT